MINWTHCNISAKVELQTILGELALHLLLVRFGRDSWAGFDSILFFYYVASSDSVFDNIDIDIDTGCFFSKPKLVLKLEKICIWQNWHRQGKANLETDCCKTGHKCTSGTEQTGSCAWSEVCRYINNEKSSYNTFLWTIWYRLSDLRI